MRQLLVDHARRRGRRKRGGDAARVELSEELIGGRDPTTEILDLDRALTALEARDPRKARIVELRYFGGLSYEELAEVTDLSPATVGRELKFARAWLRRELGEESDDGA